MKKNKSFSFIDLFSGCGGLSHGLEMAGHRCLLGVDTNKEAIKSFAANHHHAQVYLGDIKQLKEKKLHQLLGGQVVDMVVGGPPCQGFSTVGRGVVDDDRNQLFKEFVRIVKATNPKVIIFENVTGLVAKKNQIILNKIFQYFERLGYNMDARVLSAEEFGVPEKRRRTIIMGVKGGECLFPLATHGTRASKKIVTVKQAFKNLKANDGRIYNHDLKQAEVKKREDVERLKFIPAGRGIRYQQDEKEYLPKKLWYKHDWNKIDEKRFREAKYHRLDRSKPSPTIVTSRTMYYHPTENRYLTTREAASLQSFPLDFEFCGNITSQWTQIGNAVPFRMAFEIAKCLKEMLKDKKKTTNKDISLGSDNIETVRSLAFNYEKDIYLFKEKKFKQLELPI
jgi:DNA (cytosine-5)-methyltransferase 1